MNGSFIRGWLAASTLTCLYQDFLGLEEYTSRVRANWIDIPWQVWVPVLCFIVGFESWATISNKKH